ncbi:MAG: LPS export ABC transporter periplasmic protein LptC [Alphaproteobacteria bacterium]|nr:LPS export ABC transporter periplasmic protein LptC [Alphaproteobacteria bacterium]
MTDEQDINTPKNVQATRLSGLDAKRASTEQSLNSGYSRFIKRVQLVLPLIALLIVVLIFTVNDFEGDKIVPIKEEDAKPNIKQEIGKNELIKPRFESIDEKGQPFIITADMAIQENSKQGEMLLENPKGTLDTNSGENITITAENGAYQQIEQTLNLSKNVILEHSKGYKMYTSILYVDMTKDKAWSQEPVRVTGPTGSINAQGIQASAKDETIIFKGPAKMLINTQSNTIGFGAILP